MNDQGGVPSTNKREIERSFNFYKGAVVAIFAVWIAVSTLLWWRAGSPPGPYARVTDVTPLGPTAVCPGEELVYQLQIEAEGPVVFDLDVTTWQVKDMDVKATGDTWRIVIAEDMERSIVVRWRVPVVGVEPGQGALSLWEPGYYQRVYAVGTPFRNTVPSVVTLPFTVKEGCDVS